MSGLVRLTLIRYPPRALSDRRDRREAWLPVRPLAGTVLVAAWVAAGIWMAASVANGDAAWPRDAGDWLLPAASAVGGLALVLGCGVLWQRGHRLATYATLPTMAVLAVAVNFGAGESKALLALGGSVLAGLPVWLLYAWLRMSGAERRGRRA